jgi:hypothetical protein
MMTAHTPSTQDGRGRRNVAAAAILLVCAFLAYGRTLGFETVWDDKLILANMRPPQGTSEVRHLLSVPLLPDTPYYRPVVILSLRLDEILSRALPAAFHITSVLLHGVVSVLVYFTALAVGASWQPALLGSALFAVTPLHVESVAFVSGRTDLWAALFILSALLLWEAAHTRERVPAAYVVASSLALFLGVLSKETAVMLPMIPVVWSLAEQRARSASGEARKTSGSFLPWLAGWGTAVGAAVAMRLTVARLGMPHGEPTGLTLAVKLWLGYARMLIIPWPVRTYYTEANLPVGPVDVVITVLGAALLFLAARRGGGRFVASRGSSGCAPFSPRWPAQPTRRERSTPSALRTFRRSASPWSPPALSRAAPRHRPGARRLRLRPWCSPASGR